MRQGPWGRSSWFAALGCSWKSETGAGVACPAVSPADVPMRCVPGRVVNGEQVQQCMENFLPPVPGKVLKGFFSLTFPIYQGQRDPAAACNPAGAHRGPQQRCRQHGRCISISSGVSGMAVNASPPSLATTRGGWSRAGGSFCGQLYEFPITSLPCHRVRGSCT